VLNVAGCGATCDVLYRHHHIVDAGGLQKLRTARPPAGYVGGGDMDILLTPRLTLPTRTIGVHTRS
jgi:hypothetical protein